MWHYQDKNGQWQGPINGVQLKILANNGTVTRKTPMRGANGNIIPAERIDEFPLEKEWYYRDKRDQWQGPFDKKEVQPLAENGIICPDTVMLRRQRGQQNGQQGLARQLAWIQFPKSRNANWSPYIWTLTLIAVLAIGACTAWSFLSGQRVDNAGAGFGGKGFPAPVASPADVPADAEFVTPEPKVPEVKPEPAEQPIVVDKPRPVPAPKPLPAESFVSVAPYVEYPYNYEEGVIFHSFSPDTSKFITLKRADGHVNATFGMGTYFYTAHTARICVTATGKEITTVNFAEKLSEDVLESRSDNGGTIRVKRKTSSEAADAAIDNQDRFGIKYCCFFPDNNRVLFACANGIIRIFDIEKNQVVISFPWQYDREESGSSEMLTKKMKAGSQILISPDGKKVVTKVTTEKEKGWAIWDVNTGRKIADMTLPKDTGYIVKSYLRPLFSPDSTKLLIPEKRGSTAFRSKL